MNNRRWQQRFENFTQAYQKLVMVVEYNNSQPNEIAKLALILAFRFNFELVLKILSDYMTEEGLEVSSPKSLLQQALKSNYLSNGEIWMKALKQRNPIMLSYDALVMEETATFIIDDFYPAVKDWYLAFSERQ